MSLLRREGRQRNEGWDPGTTTFKGREEKEDTQRRPEKQQPVRWEETRKVWCPMMSWKPSEERVSGRRQWSCAIHQVLQGLKICHQNYQDGVHWWPSDVQFQWWKGENPEWSAFRREWACRGETVRKENAFEEFCNKGKWKIGKKLEENRDKQMISQQLLSIQKYAMTLNIYPIRYWKIQDRDFYSYLHSLLNPREMTPKYFWPVGHWGIRGSNNNDHAKKLPPVGHLLGTRQLHIFPSLIEIWKLP